MLDYTYIYIYIYIYIGAMLGTALESARTFAAPTCVLSAKVRAGW